MQAQQVKESRLSGASRVPAWLDLLQGLSGLLLVLFIWAHSFFESSILLGNDAMFAVSRLFEGEYFFGKPYPLLVTGIALVILLLFCLHAVIAIRKMPASFQEHRRFWQHARTFRHGDTTLWLLQVITGLILMFLVFAHLYQMMAQPANIGPYASADRVWTGVWWPFYLLLLLVVHVHAGVGVYRLVVKWGWIRTTSASQARLQLKRVRWGITAFFLLLGLLTLAEYMKIGYEHRHQVGERYSPVEHSP